MERETAQAAPDTPVGRSAIKRSWFHHLKPFAPLIALVALCLLIGTLNPRFFEFGNFVRVANSAAIPLVLALGVTFVILLGSIDLSVEGLVTVGAVLVSLVLANQPHPGWLSWGAAALAMLVCAGVGTVTGIIHVGLRIPSFMVSLGMWFFALGTATVILGGQTVRVMDAGIRSLALVRFLEFPLAVWVALIALAITWVIERQTRFGRYVYAIGGGEDLAALSGIPVNRVKVLVFTLAGALYGLGGVLSAAQLGQGNAQIGSGRLFLTVTAVVVGGTALTGGEGGVLNTLVGVLIMAVLSNGMVLLGVSPYIQQAVQGLLIIVAVAATLDRARIKIAK